MANYSVTHLTICKNWPVADLISRSIRVPKPKTKRRIRAIIPDDGK